VSDDAREAQARLRSPALLIAFFLGAFVVVPLAVVSRCGGGNLDSRFQQWSALRQSIQSEDPTREIIDDPQADTELIASYLWPAPDRAARARSYYEQWRANRTWWTVEMHLRGVDYAQDRTRAAVTYEIEIKHLEDKRETERRRTSRLEQWERRDGVWYLRESEDSVLEVLEPRPRGFLLP
jgi:hypothetical protein